MAVPCQSPASCRVWNFFYSIRIGVPLSTALCTVKKDWTKRWVSSSKIGVMVFQPRNKPFWPKKGKGTDCGYDMVSLCWQFDSYSRDEFMAHFSNSHSIHIVALNDPAPNPTPKRAERTSHPVLVEGWRLDQNDRLWQRGSGKAAHPGGQIGRRPGSAKAHRARCAWPGALDRTEASTAYEWVQADLIPLNS